MPSLQDLHELYYLVKALFAILLFGCLFVAFGGAMLVAGFEAIRVRWWPQVAGAIVVSEVDVTTMDMGPGNDPHVSRYPIIEYAYEVSGKPYRNRRIRMLSDSVADADELVGQYPKGTPVTVYYKPSDPKEAVIDPRIPRWHLTSLLILSAIIASIVMFCIYKFTPVAHLLESPRPH